MIDTDLLVTRFNKKPTGKIALTEAFADIRQCGFGYHRLMFLHPRNVSIAEKRHAIGRKGQDVGKRAPDAFQRLMRKPVEHITIDRTDATCTDGINDGLGLFEGLDAIDRLLDGRIEILNAETCARQTNRRQRVITGFVQIVRIHFDADFGIGGDIE
ncbi:hypothetical protein D3C87_1397890 [compost metagenome]